MPEDRFAIGSEIAGYRIEAQIARGGMGVVYRATHLALERQVALKVIAQELAGNEAFRQRFLRESRIAARLDHPAVVPIYDSREVDGELIVAMKLIEGGDLRRLLDSEGPLQPARALALLGQVAEALDAAHAAGIVHRDVKPHNILVEGDRAFLTDFGLAKAMERGEGESSASVVGTAEYMSPEQWRGDSIGPAADVYSLGCVLFEALTGIAPFARKESETEPEMPEGLDAVIEHAVAKDPADRYPTAGALIAAAREREDAGMAATGVLSASDVDSERPTWALGKRRAPVGFSFGSLQGRRLLWVGAGVAALVALVVVLVLVLGGSGGPKVTSVEVGAPPLRIATSPDATWVVSEGDGTLSKLDPESGEVEDSYRLGAGIQGVAYGAGTVWVSDPVLGTVKRVDPETGAVLREIEFGNEATGPIHPGPIVYGGHRVWVAGAEGEGISAFDLRDRSFRRNMAPRTEALRLAVGAGGLWVSSNDTGFVQRIGFFTSRSGAPIRVGGGPAGLTVGGGRVWVANAASGRVTLIDSATQTVSGAIEIGDRPAGIDAGTSTVWVALAGQDAVARISLASGEVDGSPVGVGPEPGAVAVGETAVWVGNNGDGTVTRIEP
ncbi:MAG TPA: serine/threonine-protein kinase [Solirubrobacterales bacterium]|nr:serine/threonine-protein kinase [Solirubrobacterales bacterium]